MVAQSVAYVNNTLFLAWILSGFFCFIAFVQGWKAIKLVIKWIKKPLELLFLQLCINILKPTGYVMQQQV